MWAAWIPQALQNTGATRVLSPAGVASEECDGVLLATVALSPAGDGIAEAEGAVDLGPVVSPAGGGSAESVGALDVGPALELVGGGSSEAVGSVDVGPVLAPAGGGSAESVPGKPPAGHGSLIAQGLHVHAYEWNEQEGAGSLGASVRPTGASSSEEQGPPALAGILSPFPSSSDESASGKPPTGHGSLIAQGLHVKGVAWDEQVGTPDVGQGVGGAGGPDEGQGPAAVGHAASPSGTSDGGQGPAAVAEVLGPAGRSSDEMQGPLAMTARGTLAGAGSAENEVVNVGPGVGGAASSEEGSGRGAAVLEASPAGVGSLEESRTGLMEARIGGAGPSDGGVAVPVIEFPLELVGFVDTREGVGRTTTSLVLAGRSSDEGAGPVTGGTIFVLYGVSDGASSRATLAQAGTLPGARDGEAARGAVHFPIGGTGASAEERGLLVRGDTATLTGFSPEDTTPAARTSRLASWFGVSSEEGTPSIAYITPLPARVRIPVSNSMRVALSSADLAQLTPELRESRDDSAPSAGPVFVKTPRRSDAEQSTPQTGELAKGAPATSSPSQPTALTPTAAPTAAPSGVVPSKGPRTR